MQSKQLTTLIIDVLGAAKALDIIILGVRGMTNVTDYMIVASGTSTRHVRALADHVAEKASMPGHKPIGFAGEEAGELVLLDLQDVPVHVMLP